EYAMKVQDSFLVCTGEIGTGKTTLINDAISQRSPQSVIARIQVANRDVSEFMQMLLLEFGIEPYAFSKVQMMDQVKQFLLKQNHNGHKVLLFVDEAHRLDEKTLEDIRYLSDMEYDQRKLMSIILVGQPALNDMLDQPGMEHILQRIRLRFHIKAFGIEDVAKYIQHRLSVAGAKNKTLFEESCMPMIHQFTGGRVRLINTLCDYALMYCCVEKLPLVTDWVIQKAANELQWESYEKRFGEYSEVTRFKMNMPAQSQQNLATLVMRCNNQKQGEFELNKACLSIGRHMDNDISIDDHKVSRNHAQIILQSGHAYLHDLHSTNGTFVNKNKVNLHQLQHGDEFKIGDYIFSYVEVVKSMANFWGVDSLEVPSEKEPTRVRKKSPVLSLV
ncbi:MAG TPA: FHA domain-containing protein, partial [Gammaproteobacteria bacterium]|nr:FHA domain-containing protein [Gammaproteobacteria bacterium]